MKKYLIVFLCFIGLVYAGVALVGTSSQLINYGDNDAFSFGNGTTDSPFSFSIWAYPTTTATAFPIITRRSTADVEYLLVANITTGKLMFVLYDDVSTVSIRCAQKASTTNNFTINVWHNIITTYDGSSLNTGLHICLDGSRYDDSVASAGAYVAMSNTTDSLVLGKLTTTFATGNIADFRLYNRELTATEAAQISSARGADIVILNGLIRTPLNDFPDGIAAGVSLKNQWSNTLYGATAINSPLFINTPIRSSKGAR